MSNLYKFYTPENIVDFIVEKMKPYITEDTVIIEPSAGDGAILDKLEEEFSNTILAYDIAPEDDRVVKQDFLSLCTKEINNAVVIGNPPFGERNVLSVKFYKKCIAFADVIGLILPISQLNNSPQMYEFDLVESYDLGVQNYSGKMLHCCFNIYKRPKGGLNKKEVIKVKGLEVKEYRRDKDNSYLSKITDGWYTAICSWGSGIGNIPNEVGQYSMELYFYTEDVKIQEILDAISWKDELKCISAKKLPKGIALKIIASKLKENEV